MHFERLTYYLLFFVAIGCSNPVYGADYYEETPIKFIENKGQWFENILFRAEIPGGALYLERDKLTYVFSHPDDITKLHQMHHGMEPVVDGFKVRGHAYSVELKGSDYVASKGLGRTEDYNNYFLGNDPNKWKANVSKYLAVEYQSIYPGIDFRIYANKEGLKYDFVVHPEGDIEDISLHYMGADNMQLINGDLIISTSIQNVIEKKPISFQGEKEIKTKYELNDDILKFTVSGYTDEQDLIIDPALVFASYSGSTADNWGILRRMMKPVIYMQEG